MTKEKTLRARNTELEKLHQRKDEFISTVSHQLRSPALSINQALKLANAPHVSRTDREKLLSMAESCSDRLVAIINKLFDATRLETSKVTADKTVLDCRDIILQTIRNFDFMAECHGIKISSTVPQEPVHVPVYPVRLGEALSNYLENAVKYSPKGSTVMVTLRQEPDRVCVEVLDQGIGVPRTERPFLFEKFCRTSIAKEIEPNGCGIGLFTVKLFIQEHGGDVYYRSLPKGSVFGFWIPV